MPDFKERQQKRYVTQDYQSIGLHIAATLNDPQNKSTYIRLAMKERSDLLEAAMRFVSDYPKRENTVALFLWKLKELKRVHKVIPYDKTRALELATELLLNNKLLIFPTDTVYGIGCRLYSEKAIDKLYKAKKRSKLQPTAILIADKEEMLRITPLRSPVLDRLMGEFWPGQLTIIVPVGSPELYPKAILNRKAQTIGVRLPNHTFTRELIRKVGEPIVASSANEKGAPPPGGFNEIDPKIIDKVDLVIKDPKTKIKNKPSTIVEILSDGTLNILREGDIGKALITG